MEKTRVKKGEKYWFVDDKTLYVLWDYDDDTFQEKWRFDCGNYFNTKEEAESMANKLRAVLDGAEVIEMPRYEKEIIASEEIYHQKEYDRGEYCHKQSFLWGFQEGVNFLQSRIIK